MKFQIHIKTRDGKPGKIVYDNMSNQFSYLDGSLIKIDKTPGQFIDAIAVSPETPGKKVHAVNSLKIQMGLQCNYSCSYCSQASHLEAGEATVTNVEDARKFLTTIDSWVEGEPNSIQLWGGEPFVYWKAMRVLVPGLKSRFPNADFGIITNGSLLDLEKLDWLISNNISISISHDGPGQSLRGVDPLDDPKVLDLWKIFVKELTPRGLLSVNSVLTAENCDVMAIRSWFVEKLGREVRTNFEGVVNVHDDNTMASSAKFTNVQYTTMKQSVFKAVFSDEFDRYSSLGQRAIGFFNSVVNNRPAAALGQKCGMDKESSLAVDLAGNVLTCHNTGANSKHKIGHVSDFQNIKLDTSWHWSKREYCPTCPVLQICQGGCMYLDGAGFDVTCENEFQYAVPIFAAGIYALFGATFEAFEGEIKRPKLKKVIPITAA